MKYAILLHGHVRTFIKTYNSLKLIKINKNDTIDFFIHTWDTIDRLTPSFYKVNNKTKNIKTPIDLLIKIYKPKGIKIDKQVIKNPNKTCPRNKISYEGHKYYFYSFYIANELKKQFEKKYNFKYDMCIKLRPDVIFKNIINLKLFKNNYIYLFGNPKKQDFNINNINHFQAVNVITLSNSTYMDKIANFYKKIDYYIYHQKNPRHTDYIDYIMDLKIEYKMCNYIYKKDWGFIRL
jgi:hypothetical protein